MDPLAVVAHLVSLMVVQAEKGPFVVEAGSISDTFRTIGALGREALDHLDALVGAPVFVAQELDLPER